MNHCGLARQALGQRIPFNRSVLAEPVDQSKLRFLCEEVPSMTVTSGLTLAIEKPLIFYGSIYGGHRDAVVRFAERQREAIYTILREGSVLVDQLVFLYMYQRWPEIMDAKVASTGMDNLFAEF